MTLHPLTIIALAGGLPIIILLLIGLYFEKPEDEESEDRRRSQPHPR